MVEFGAHNDPYVAQTFPLCYLKATKWMCLERIGNQAGPQLPKSEKFRITPHMLFHTFLKWVADKHNIHIAQEMGIFAHPYQKVK